LQRCKKVTSLLGCNKLGQRFLKEWVSHRSTSFIVDGSWRTAVKIRVVGLDDLVKIREVGLADL